MGPSVSIQSTRNDIDKLMTLAVQLLGQRRVHQAMANAARPFTKNYLRILNTYRQHTSPLGGERSNFYAKFAEDNNLSVRADDTEATLSIGPGGFQSGGGNPLWKHYIGGVIKPRIAKALAIPLTGEAYGHAPREFNLACIMFGKKEHGNVIGLLVKRPQSALKFSDKTGKSVKKKAQPTMAEAMYLLVRQVTLREDKSVLPTDEDYRRVGAAAVQQLVDDFQRRAASK